MVLRWFGQRFGGFWGLGSTSGADFAYVCKDLPLLEQILSLDPRAAPRSVTMRGGPPPSVVEQNG